MASSSGDRLPLRYGNHDVCGDAIATALAPPSTDCRADAPRSKPAAGAPTSFGGFLTSRRTPIRKALSCHLKP
jgi:hypothetical protein